MLDLNLQHDSQLTESGQTRRVQMEVKAVAVGAITLALAPMVLGGTALFGGFLAAARNGRGISFHITSVEPLA